MIEPVSGTVVLRNLQGAKGVTAVALDGAGRPMGEALAGRRTAAGFVLTLGEPVTTWYVIRVQR